MRKKRKDKNVKKKGSHSCLSWIVGFVAEFRKKKGIQLNVFKYAKGYYVIS